MKRSKDKRKRGWRQLCRNQKRIKPTYTRPAMSLVKTVLKSTKASETYRQCIQIATKRFCTHPSVIECKRTMKWQWKLCLQRSSSVNSRPPASFFDRISSESDEKAKGLWNSPRVSLLRLCCKHFHNNSQSRIATQETRSQSLSSLMFSFYVSDKPLKAVQSDQSIHPCFHDGVMCFRPPWQPLETPSSWPPRPALTGLSTTCVAGHVVSYPALISSSTPSDIVLWLVVTSRSSSLMPSRTLPWGDVGSVFRTVGQCVWKALYIGQRLCPKHDYAFSNSICYIEIDQWSGGCDSQSMKTWNSNKTEIILKILSLEFHHGVGNLKTNSDFSYTPLRGTLARDTMTWRFMHSIFTARFPAVGWRAIWL